MTTDNCRLCLEEAELQDSHLLPKALYRMIGRGSNRAHPDTVQLTYGSQRKSSEQARRPLLCRPCEQRLSTNGEEWMLGQCFRGQGRFRLRATLRQGCALSGADTEAYSGSEEQVARLAYFCLSVVWRASLCDWICRGERYEQIELGRYENEIRRYLKGDTDVPGRIGVMVMLSGLDRPRLEMCLPLSYREDSYHCYRFHIPGLTFVATVGGRDSQMGDRISVLEPPHPILVSNLGDRKAQNEQMALLGRTPPLGFQAPLVEGTEKA